MLFRSDRYDPAAPTFTNLFMYADADLRTGANFNAGSIGGNGLTPVSGMFIAGDQVQLETSSSGAVGFHFLRSLTACKSDSWTASSAS